MSLLTRIAFAFILLIWCTLIFVEWLVPFDQHFLFVIPILKKSFSLVCHQQEYKLFTNGMMHSLVCARCVGIYSGMLLLSLFTIVYQVRRLPGLKFFLFAAVPMLIDVILYSLGIYAYSKLIAFITGLLLGSIGFLYFCSAFIKLIQELKSNRTLKNISHH